MCVCIICTYIYICIHVHIDRYMYVHVRVIVCVWCVYANRKVLSEVKEQFSIRGILENLKQ